jgi:hypothetical protein
MDALAREHCDQTQIKRKSGPGELLVRVPRPLLEQTSLTRNTHPIVGVLDVHKPRVRVRRCLMHVH